MSDQKTCKTCQATKPVEEFPSRMDRGKERIEANCKACKKAAKTAAAPSDAAADNWQTRLNGGAPVGPVVKAFEKYAHFDHIKPVPVAQELPQMAIEEVMAKPALRAQALPMPIAGVLLSPRVAANIVRLVTRDREDTSFAITLKAHSGIYQVPEFEETEPYDPREIYYSSRDRQKEPIDDELAIAKFFVDMGVALTAWCNEEEKRREAWQAAKKKADEKKREAAKKRKAKQKKRAVAYEEEEVAADLEDQDVEEEVFE